MGFKTSGYKDLPDKDRSIAVLLSSVVAYLKILRGTWTSLNKQSSEETALKSPSGTDELLISDSQDASVNSFPLECFFMGGRTLACHAGKV